MLDGLHNVDGDHISLYTDVVMAALPEAARRSLEALMTLTKHEPISPYFRRQRREGLAEALLEVLAAREIAVPDAVRSQILASADRGQLSTWIRRAATATSIEDVID